MNCVRWSIGDASFHGMGTSLVPHQDFRCHPCPPTKMLPMSPDRTQLLLTKAWSRRAEARGSCRAQVEVTRVESPAKTPGECGTTGEVVRIIEALTDSPVNCAPAAV